jgi:hypothetical protein
LVPVTSDTASGQIAAGSYPENDARLSDTALKWMLDTATSVGLVHDLLVEPFSRCCRPAA